MSRNLLTREKELHGCHSPHVRHARRALASRIVKGPHETQLCCYCHWRKPRNRSCHRIAAGEKWARAHNLTMEKATKKFPEEAAISCFGKPEEAADLMAYMVSTAAKLMLELLSGWMGAQSKDIGSGEFITDVTR